MPTVELNFDTFKLIYETSFTQLSATYTYASNNQRLLISIPGICLQTERNTI